MGTRKVEVVTEPQYTVHIGSGLLAAAARSASTYARGVVLTDENVAGLYAEQVAREAGLPLVTVPAGEGSKSLRTLEDVLDRMVELGLDRGSCLVALGGGVVGDLGGLAASLYMRGVDVLQVPTTLLSQVDSSVGGKTAVNLRGGKNLAGTFHQPRAVFADAGTLATLPDAELASGLGEVVKTAMLDGPRAFEVLEENADALLARDPAVLAQVVEQCVRTKARVVAEDEREAGPRKALNLGHTFAHGIEHAAAYGTIPHGVAVACGLALATRLSARVGLLEPSLTVERVEALLCRLDLPAHLAQLRERSGAALTAAELVAGMRHDKKGTSGEPRYVLPKRLGEVEIDVPASTEVVQALLGA